MKDALLKRFSPRLEFDSYEDFKQNFTIRVPDDFNFGYDVVDAWAELEPGKKALVWCNDAGEERVFTFNDVKSLSNRICNYLVSLGIRKGDKVMLIMKRRWEYWMTATALHKLGAVMIPASFQLTEKDLIYRINAAGVRMIVTAEDEFIISHVENSLAQCPTLQYRALVTAKDGTCRAGWLDYRAGFMAQPDRFDRPAGDSAVSAVDPMIIYFTSGTTGMPKMVLHLQKYPLGHILTSRFWQQVEDNGLHLTVSDSGWAKFSWGKIYGAWLSGSAVLGYDMDKFVPDKLLRVIEKYRITTFCAPATMYRFMIKEDLTQYDLSSIHHCCMAGEPLNPAVFDQWEALTGHKLYEGFGQTETPVLMANFKWITPKPGSTGKPSALYDIALVNEDGKECEIGEEGEIVIRGARDNPPVGLTAGYLGDAEANERLWRGGDFHTGDNAWMDEDGYIWFIGRVDDVIKCSGYRIGPFEVESALMTHPAVLECAITAAPDPVRGQVVKATVVLVKNRGYEPTDELRKELQNHVKKVTAPYKYPRILEFVDELPKTISGKIRRAAIRHTDNQGDRQ